MRASTKHNCHQTGFMHFNSPVSACDVIYPRTTPHLIIIPDGEEQFATSKCKATLCKRTNARGPTAAMRDSDLNRADNNSGGV